MRLALSSAVLLMLASVFISARAEAQQLTGVYELENADVVLRGVTTDDRSGFSVSILGDINGDGFDDVLIGAPRANANLKNDSGQSYLVYGRGDPAPLSGLVGLFDADAVFLGIDVSDRAGEHVVPAGDVNGDGLADILISAPGGDPDGNDVAGEVYLVYGRDGAETIVGTFGLSSADVTFTGINAVDEAGHSVASAGDFNGDGFADILIGAQSADPGGITQAGETYLVYGRGGAATLSGTFDLAGADVTFYDSVAFGFSGEVVSSAGDVNGDGLDDLLIAAPRGEDEFFNPGDGRAYLVYGRNGAATLSGGFDLANADATFHGIPMDDPFGMNVASAGDFNGDGLDDFLVAAVFPLIGGGRPGGEVYLYYGRDGVDMLAGTFDVANADVTFYGIDRGDFAGIGLSAGDINGDGLSDIVLGASNADPNGEGEAGETYIVYGRSHVAPLPSAFDLTDADVTFNGVNEDDFAGMTVSATGDVNGDGLDDVLIGAYLADPYPPVKTGESYLVYGRRTAVPEPGSVSLLLAGLAVVGAARRRR